MRNPIDRRHCGSPRRRRRAALLGVLVLMPALVISARAQDRSDTGRHRSEPVEVEREPADTVPTAASGWFFGGGPALLGGGTLFRLETATGAAVPWGPTGSPLFTSSRFRTRLDTNLGLALYAGRDWGERWSLRLDLAYGQLDVAAEARQGQSAGVFRFDRLGVTTVGLGVEARLTSTPSYPLFTAGVVMARLGASRESGLDQSQVGVRVGLGYSQVLGNNLALRLEGRLLRSAFTLDDFAPSVASGPAPEIELDVSNSLTFFEIVLGVALKP